MNIVNGDIFESKEDILVHQVNCLGVMGAGLALEVRKRYPLAFARYVSACNLRNNLGTIQTVRFKDRIICNLFGQYAVSRYSKCTDYIALENAFRELAMFCKESNYSVALPYKLGCGLAGGDWLIVSDIIETELQGVPYTVYRKL